jgi:hypothetical protein
MQDRLRELADEAWRRYPEKTAAAGDARIAYVRSQLMSDVAYAHAIILDQEHGTDTMGVAIAGLLAGRKPHGS